MLVRVSDNSGGISGLRHLTGWAGEGYRRPAANPRNRGAKSGYYWLEDAAPGRSRFPVGPGQVLSDSPSILTPWRDRATAASSRVDVSR